MTRADLGQFIPAKDAAFRVPDNHNGNGNGHAELRSGLVVPKERGLSVERFAVVPETVKLGTTDVRFDIKSSMGPFHVLPDYKAEYPDTVVTGLGQLYREYNRAFTPLIEANREWDTDYQYLMTGPDGTPINPFVQIDMMGLPSGYLDAADGASQDSVTQGLRGNVFEIENSLAMYQLLENLFPRDGEPSTFAQTFRTGLDQIRERTGKPIALLAVTEEKAEAMRTTEFGKEAGEPISDDEVRQLTGFDKFFGPQEFADHVRANGGDSAYILFARTSEPVSKLRKPSIQVDNPLLADPDMRRVIKANAITPNVDNPALDKNDPARINDTKEYLEPMGMAMTATSPDDIYTVREGTKKGEQPTVVMSDKLAEHLISHGVDPLHVASMDVRLRAKPLRSSYGCYGHTSGTLRDKGFRADVRKGIKDRGHYVVQPEMPTPTLVDEATGQEFLYIDRNFMTFAGDAPVFMGGFRSLMPMDTAEARNNRIHGNAQTHWAEVRG